MGNGEHKGRLLSNVLLARLCERRILFDWHVLPRVIDVKTKKKTGETEIKSRSSRVLSINFAGAEEVLIKVVTQGRCNEVKINGK